MDIAAINLPVCPRCLGEGQILGVPNHDLPRGWVPLPEDWYDCDECDGKGYLEGGTRS